MFQILNPFKAGSEFQKLKSKRKWILAVTIVLVPTILSGVGNHLVQQENQASFQQLAEQQGGQTATPPQGGGPPGNPNPMGMIIPFGSLQPGGATSSSGTITLSLILGIIFALIFWVLKSVVFHIGSRIMRGEGAKISSTIHMMAFTSIPFIFKGILDVIKEITHDAPSSMETFMTQTGTSSLFLNFIRNHFTIFVVWALFLMVIAVREQYSLGNKKAFCVVLVPYIAVWVLQMTLFSSSGFMGVV
ncbi:MAG: YIP1 family protein [Candidatus Methanofastidiosia archaeon]